MQGLFLVLNLVCYPLKGLSIIRIDQEVVKESDQLVKYDVVSYFVDFYGVVFTQSIKRKISYIPSWTNKLLVYTMYSCHYESSEL